MQKSKFNLNAVYRLVSISLLIALNVVLSRFLSIQTIDFKIGFSFITVVIAARAFGPIAAMLVNGIGDFIGAILFPKGAIVFPLTLTAALFGLIFGLFLYKKLNFKTIVLSVLTTQVVCTLFLNSYILSLYFGLDFWASVTTRLVQSLIMSIVQILFMVLFLEKIVKLISKAKGKNDRRSI